VLELFLARDASENIPARHGPGTPWQRDDPAITPEQIAFSWVCFREFLFIIL
jgi:hypothetical protein